MGIERLTIPERLYVATNGFDVRFYLSRDILVVTTYLKNIGNPILSFPTPLVFRHKVGQEWDKSDRRTFWLADEYHKGGPGVNQME